MSQGRYITEFWLGEVGFKPHWFGGQPYKHWRLWIADDASVELSLISGDKQKFFCWIVGGGEHTPQKTVHVRNLTSKHEVIQIVQALSGRRWNPKSHRNGSAVRRSL